MNSEKQDRIIDKIRNLISRKEKSVKIFFNPDQLFIGNYSVKIDDGYRLSIGVNKASRLAIFFRIAANPAKAFVERDVALSLNKVVHIALKNEKNEEPPVIVCSIDEDAYQRLCTLQPSLKEEIEGSFKNAISTRNLIFVLKPIDNDSFVKVEYQAPNYEGHYFDFDRARSFLVEDIAAVWADLLTESKKKNTAFQSDRNNQLVTVMNDYEWTHFLSNNRLAKADMNRNGYVYYYRKGNEEKGKVKVNSAEYIRGKRANIPNNRDSPDIGHLQLRLKHAKRRKIAQEDLSKQIQLTNGECWVSGPEEQRESLIRPVGDRYDNHHGLQSFFVRQYINKAVQANNRNGAVHHNGNGQNPDIEDVTEGMRHLGEEVQNVEMRDDPEEQINADALLQAGDVPAGAFEVDAHQIEEEEEDQDNIQGDFAPPRRRPPPKIDGNEELFMFPPQGVTSTDHVSVCIKDVRTLDRKEFLNDNVMSFMLNYIRHLMIDSRLQERIYMSNTFLYSKLTRHLPSLCFSGRKPVEPEAEELLTFNANQTLRWTRKFDVFTKDYLVIPINEDLHWMVIAVINPGGGIVDMDDEVKSREEPKCYIVFFDPLSGLDPSRRNHMCHCIKRWLLVLYQTTKAPSKRFAEKQNTIYDEERVVVLRSNNTPVQDNFSDCGLYALHFIEGLFCSPNGPVSVKKFPEFDWADLYPEAEKMCDLMRDKVYNLILKQAAPLPRSRLERFEQQVKCGLSREGRLRKTRRHSAALRRTPRHPDHYPRHYSLSPPSFNVMYDDPTFTNPRRLASWPITQLARQKALPIENFPIAY